VSEHEIRRGDASQIGELRPLWLALREYHVKAARL